MSDERAFLAAILAEPRDDNVRLVYADWLDEHDRPGRAEFIRVQVELARADDSWRPADGSPPAVARDRLRARERLLFHVHGIAWCEAIGCGNGENGRSLPQAFLDWWSRGFLSSVECSAADWLAHADQIAAVHPVTRVVLTTMPTGSWARVLYATMERVCVEVAERQVMAKSAHDADILEARWPGVEFELPPEPTFEDFAAANAEVEYPLGPLTNAPFSTTAGGANYAAARASEQAWNAMVGGILEKMIVEDGLLPGGDDESEGEGDEDEDEDEDLSPPTESV